MSQFPSTAGRRLAAIAVAIVMLGEAHAYADADYTDHPTQYCSILPPVTSTGCFLPVTKTRMLGLPRAQTDLWEADGSWLGSGQISIVVWIHAERSAAHELCGVTRETV